jgi:multidrug/hemolysin transport system ATP-binding protein
VQHFNIFDCKRCFQKEKIYNRVKEKRFIKNIAYFNMGVLCMEHVIEVNNLVKRYDNVLAVNNISFTVEENSFFAFLGPNGAGKSTTINIIATLLSYDKGEVKILGMTLGKDDEKIRENVGVVFQQNMLDNLLTVYENLRVRASFYGLDKVMLDKRLEEIGAYLDLKDFLYRRYGQLSGGQRRKADIARALLHWPKLLMLDEPTTGLDPKSRKDIWALINRLRQEKNITIFLTTHYMEEVKDANKIVVIDHGKIKAIGSSEQLRSKYSYDRVKILPKNGLKEALKKAKVDYYELNNSVNVKVESCFDGIFIVEQFKDFIAEFEIIRGDMDDVFLNITGHHLEGNG